MKKSISVSILIILTVIISILLVKIEGDDKEDRSIIEYTFEKKENRQFEELYCVKKGDKYGYKNISNEWIVAAQYDQAFAFKNGVGVVCKDNEYLVINDKNEVILRVNEEYIVNIPKKGYYTLESIDNHEYLFVLLDNSGKEVLISNSHSLSIVNETYIQLFYGGDNVNILRQVYDYNGNMINESYIMEPSEVYPEGVYWSLDENSQMYFLENLKGVKLTENIYEKVHWFYNGYAAAHRNGEVYIINVDGDEVSKVLGDSEYTHFKYFREGIGVFYDSALKKEGYVDILSGEIIIEPQFEIAREMRNGVMEVKMADGIWKLIDRNYEMVVEGIYEGMILYDNEIVKVAKDNKVYYMDIDGNMIINDE